MDTPGMKACIAAGPVTQDPDRELDIVQLSILRIQTVCDAGYWSYDGINILL